VAAYRDALQEWTRERVPLQWATPVLQKKLNEVVQCRADLPAKERRFLADALRAVAKRFEQIADKIDIDEPPEITSISPDAPGAAP
jgi:hypothetical protein